MVTPDTGASGDSEIQFTADNAESSTDEATLTGNVEVQKGDQRLRAPQLTLDRRTNRIKTPEGVLFGAPNLALRAKEAEFDLDKEQGRFHDTEYFLPERNAQGSAKRVDTDARKEQTRLRSVTYSTCARGDEIWQLRTNKLKLNQESGRGTARNATFAYKGVPFLYFPYLSFPIKNERQSGFLIPRGGVNTDNGIDITIPYYWNMAPNRDMTFFPRYLGKRGVLIGAEFRFLQPRHKGEILGEYLPHDSERREDRGSLRVTHQARPFRRLFTDLLYEFVSDDDYLDDLNPNIDLLSPNYLERHLNANYFGGNWRALARIQDFQTLDRDVFNPRNQPYDRLPQLRFNGSWPGLAYGLSPDLRTEFVNFDHDVKTTGARFDITPRLSLPLQRPSGFLIPRLSFRFTDYSLDDTETGISESPSRGLPIFSVDSGLFFERTVNWKWWDLLGIMTLEPRLFYLYVPKDNQDNIPIFDTTLVDRSFGWLFLENRFTGADRLGDANQVTTAITSRILNAQNGRERFRLNIGQIQYFRDREVTLPDLPPGTSRSSALIAETVVQIGPGLSLRGNLQFDTGDAVFRRSSVDLYYNPGDNDRLLNFSYRFAENEPEFRQRREINQIDISGLWPINEQWRTMARWNYSLQEAQNLDIFAGFEYRECCWAFRFVLRQNRPNPQNDAKLSFFAELELRGLAGIGTGVTDLMEDHIRGFQGSRY